MGTLGQIKAYQKHVVCEWLYIDDGMYFDSDCGERYDGHDAIMPRGAEIFKKFKFCPYCGKPIKIQG